ncbi:MAG: hypothetical protein L0I76_26815 [Pseudonocardia sp.]|nr:hypothetical protein [Pseudonocardia sp.]
MTYLVLGPPTRITVKLPTGLLPRDIEAASDRLAPHLGCYGLRVESRGLGAFAVVELLRSDPLAEIIPFRPGPMTGPILIGHDETGQEVAIDPGDLPHMAIQGSTRSGKSVFCYGFLSQLAQRDDVRIAGVDASGLLLRPFPNDRFRVVGLKNPIQVEQTLAGLVSEMDRRITAIPFDRDTLETGPDNPLIVCVLEEYPGTLRALDAFDPKGAKKVRLYVARLLAESRKAGIVVVMIAQRCEAQIIGSAERAQMAGRISFRVDTADSVKLLHPDAPDSLAVEHTNAPPGIGLLTLPGRSLSRVRAPFLPYAGYVKAVGQAGPQRDAA